MKTALRPISEAEFLRQVLALAKLRGWRAAHFRPCRTATGWRTAVQGDGKGFPDLCLCRPPRGGKPGRLLFAELKTDAGRLTDAQQVWLDVLLLAGVEVHVWRPAAWGLIEEVLA